jgi:hypothetical protein
VAGLGWWAHAQWVDRQRKLWREHDAKLAAVWRGDAPPAGDNVIVLPDVREAPARKAHVTVLPEGSRAQQP